MTPDPLACYNSVLGWLTLRFPGVDHDPHIDAAHDAILAALGYPSLLPRRYQWVTHAPVFTRIQEVEHWLQRYAWHTLMHLLRHEQNEHAYRQECEGFAARTAPDTLRVVVGREALQEAVSERVPPTLYQTLSTRELWLLELILLGVKDAQSAAHVLGVSHLPLPQARAIVRDTKNRVFKRWHYAAARAAGASVEEAQKCRKVG